MESPRNMKTSNFKRWLFAAMLALAGPAHPLDLVQAYQAALQSDPSLRAAQAAAEAGRETVSQARSQLYPNIAFGAARTHNDLHSTQPDLAGQAAGTQQRYFSDNQALTVRQPLYRKHLLDGVEQAGRIAEDAEAALERERQALAVRVAGAYMDALLAQDHLALVQAQIKTTVAQLDAARKAVTAGSGTRTDIDEAQSRLDLATALELEARQNVEFTRLQLRQLTDRPVDSLARLDAATLPLLGPTPALVDDWVRLAEGHSPELASLDARQAAARLAVEKARSGHYPSLDAVLQVVRSTKENVTAPNSSYTNRSIGVQLSVPLYSGGYASSAVRQALAEQNRAQDLRDAGRRDLALRIHREFRGVTEGVLRIRAREQSARSAEQLVQSSQRAQQAGSRTSLDVLNAEEKRQLAARDLAQSRYDYLMARIRLRALAGEDPLQTLAEVNAWLKPGPP
jgi:protease secretion system outer membrane protein